MLSFSNRIFSLMIALSFFGISADMRAEVDVDEAMVKASDDFVPDSVSYATDDDKDDKDEAMVKASNVLIAGDEEGDNEEMYTPDTPSDDEEDGNTPQDIASFGDNEHVFNLEDDNDDDTF